MTLSQTYRTALIAIAGFLLTALFHTGAVAQANAPQGVRNIVIVHGAWADGSSWSKVIPLLQAKGLHVVVSPDNRIQQLLWRRGPGKPSIVKTAVAKWLDYKKVGPLLVSLDHRGTGDGKPLRIFFTDVAVKLTGSDTWVNAQ